MFDRNCSTHPPEPIQVSCFFGRRPSRSGLPKWPSCSQVGGWLKDDIGWALNHAWFLEVPGSWRCQHWTLPGGVIIFENGFSWFPDFFGEHTFSGVVQEDPWLHELPRSRQSIAWDGSETLQMRCALAGCGWNRSGSHNLAPQTIGRGQKMQICIR